MADVLSLTSQSTRPDVTSLLVEGGASQSKLKNIEAQRILAVLQEIQRKMALMTLLPERLDGRLTMVFGEDFSRLISEHHQLETKYENLLQAKQLDRGSEELSMELKDTAKQLRGSTRSLCRYLNAHSNSLFPKLRYLNTKKHPAVCALEERIQEMKVVLFDRLRTTVEEERARQNQVTSIMNKEQRTDQEVKVLQEELAIAKAKREKEIESKNDIIRGLKETLRDIKGHAEDATKRMEHRSRQKEELEGGQYQVKEKSMHTETQQFRKQLDEFQTRDREEEAAMRKKKAKIENEVEAWISKYDQEMEEKQTEIDELTAIYMEEKANLDELVQKFNGLSARWQEILDQRALQAELKRQLDEQKKTEDLAATKIQSIYRGYAVRRDIKKKKKTDKKGGKKKK